MNIDPARLAKVMAEPLKSGAHQSFSRGACVMEAVAYVAGEKWSDTPECACPVIGAFLRSWNDSLKDEPRERLLKPLVPLLVGSKSTPEAEERRSYMALDWLIRVFTPKWLDLVPVLHEHAKALRDLDAITDMAEAAAPGKRVNAAGDAAGDAARDAARDAAGDAAEDAARDAAGSAAWVAAGVAAEDAAGVAAWVAAGDAAWVAAGDAAWDALKPTTEWLQASALDLVQRMLEAA